MQAFRKPGNRLAAALVAAAAAFWTAPVGAAGSDDDIETKYQRDRTLCLTGLTHQQRSDCLREAGAARDEARRGRLRDQQPPSEYTENAMKRCRQLPEADRADCEARVRGEGTQRGSVEAGGIYREKRTVLPPRSGGD